MSEAHYNSWWSTNFEISRQLSLDTDLFGLLRTARDDCKGVTLYSRYEHESGA